MTFRISKYSWILVWSLIFAHCLYFLDTPCTLPDKGSHNICRNRTAKAGESHGLPKNSNTEKSSLTTNVSAKRLTSNLPCETVTDESSTVAERDECFYGIGVFISLMTMFIISYKFQKSIELKRILSCNLFLCYTSQGFIFLFFVLRRWNIHIAVDYKVLMCDIATLSNFVLLTTLSWSSIVSSDLCMVKSYAIWDVKKINGSIRITNKESFLLSSALISVLFYSVSMGIIYSMYVLTYVLECDRFRWVFQNSTSPLMFTVTVCLMVILNFVCFFKRINLDEIEDNSSEFEHYVFHARENNNTFFCLSVLFYIMWVFNAVVFCLDLSWLWTLFLVIYHLEGFVLLFFRFSLSVVRSKSRDYIPDAEELPFSFNYPRPPRHRLNTLGA